MKTFLVVFSILLVMILVPFLVFQFVPDDAGLIACLMLFYIIYPMFSVGVGIVSGLFVKRMWWISLLIPVSFIASGFLIIKMGSSSFFYSAVYFVLCLISMIITAIIKYNKDRRS